MEGSPLLVAAESPVAPRRQRGNSATVVLLGAFSRLRNHSQPPPPDHATIEPLAIPHRSQPSSPGSITLISPRMPSCQPPVPKIAITHSPEPEPPHELHVRLLDRSAQPVLARPGSAAASPTLLEPSQPALSLADAFAAALGAPVSQQGTALGEYLRPGSAARAGVGAFLQSPEALPQWSHIAAHVAAEARALPAFLGVAHCVLLGAHKPVAAGDRVQCFSLATATTTEAPVLAAAMAVPGSVVLHVVVRKRGTAWVLGCQSGPLGAAKSELLLAPCASFKISFVGKRSSGQEWAVADEELPSGWHQQPSSAVSSLDISETPAEAVILRAMDNIDQDNRETAVHLLRLLFLRSTSAHKNPLRLLTILALRGLRMAWPQFFSDSDPSEVDLLERLLKNSAESLQSATRSAIELAEAAPESGAALWLSGTWRVLIAPASEGLDGMRQLERSYRRGSALAASTLAVVFERDGALAAQDLAEVQRLCTFASGQSCASAMVALGSLRLSDTCVGLRDAYDAARLFAITAQIGSTAGCFLLGKCILDGNGISSDPQKAVRLLRSAADQGHSGAQYTLGICYLNGTGGLPHDRCASAKLFELSAIQGDSSAQFQYAMCLMTGEGVPARDAQEAFHMFKLAASTGNVDAMVQIGICFEQGTGVKASTTDAIMWYQVAVEKGSALAHYRLGLCFKNGIGVKKDRSAASKHFSIAEDLGFAEARAAVQSL